MISEYHANMASGAGPLEAGDLQGYFIPRVHTYVFRIIFAAFRSHTFQTTTTLPKILSEQNSEPYGGCGGSMVQWVWWLNCSTPDCHFKVPGSNPPSPRPAGASQFLVDRPHWQRQKYNRNKIMHVKIQNCMNFSSTTQNN